MAIVQKISLAARATKRAAEVSGRNLYYARDAVALRFLRY